MPTGGFGLFFLYMQRERDRDFVLNYVKTHENNADWIEKNQSGLAARFPDDRKERAIQLLRDGIKALILEKKRTEWWMGMLEEEFFYKDPSEQMEIINIAHSIADGKRDDLPLDREWSGTNQRLEEALAELIGRNLTFSLEAFIQFRLRSYREKMGAILEAAIDEYKLEQDYQMFLQYLRDFLKGRRPLMTRVHILDGDQCKFFDEWFRPIPTEELERYIDRKLLSSHPVYVDSTTIAPLISIAPEEIYYYTRNQEKGIVKTLKNIFEEKLKICSPESFAGHRRNPGVPSGHAPDENRKRGE